MHTYTVWTRCTTCQSEFTVTQVHNKPMSAYARCTRKRVIMNREGKATKVICNAENLVVAQKFRWNWDDSAAADGQAISRALALEIAEEERLEAAGRNGAK